jgi:hypothetical protein
MFEETDVVVSNDRAYLEPAGQPPEATEVKRLYKDLWGRARPSNLPIPGYRVSELIINEIFPPVTAEDVSERLSKMRKKAIAGPDKNII